MWNRWRHEIYELLTKAASVFCLFAQLQFSQLLSFTLFSRPRFNSFRVSTCSRHFNNKTHCLSLSHSDRRWKIKIMNFLKRRKKMVEEVEIEKSLSKMCLSLPDGPAKLDIRLSKSQLNKSSIWPGCNFVRMLNCVLNQKIDFISHTTRKSFGLLVKIHIYCIFTAFYSRRRP